MSGEIISVAQMRAIDTASAAAGVPTRTLMENAGRAVADAIAARFSPRKTAVLCGPGANGGDGFVAARLLRERGWPVWVETFAPVATGGGDAADAAQAWRGETLPISADNPMAELFVDALFGAGLSRPLEGEAARLANALPPERVVAIDTPSGLHGDLARPLGDACFRAALTVTFVRKKPAHVLFPGRMLCGEIIVADIGAPESVMQAQNIKLWENDPALWRDAFLWPADDAHKHARGHVIVASGGALRTGAARLAARGALRIGAGLVTVLSPRDALAINAAHLTAIMLREGESDAEFAQAAQDASCVVLGPAFGLDETHRARLNAALTTPNRAPLVLDADALTLLAGAEIKLTAKDAVTPHVGEFNRLFPGLLAKSPTRIDAARAAAVQIGAIVLLKGPDTVIATPDGRAIVNTTGAPYLATAGAGDVLAGIIAGLIGQGMESFLAAAAGAWLHGRVGEALGPGLIAEDLSEQLPPLLKDLAKLRARDRNPA